LSENYSIYPGTIAYRSSFLIWREMAKFYVSVIDKDKIELMFRKPEKKFYEGYNDCCKYMDIFKKTEKLDKDTI
jgi:hypothetical protein